MARWGVPDARIVVAPPRPGPGAARPRPRDGRRARHFLYVGDDEPRKNLRCCSRRTGASRAADALPLVIAGTRPARVGWP